MTLHDEVEIEDMEWDEDMQAYTYPCPCGDKFQIFLDQLREGDEIGTCPSCSLHIRVIYDVEDFLEESEDEESGADA